jgi:serine/threonine protein kinase
MKPRGLKFGSFRPTCPACDRRFELHVRRDADGGQAVSTSVGLEDGDDDMATALGLTVAPKPKKRKKVTRKPPVAPTAAASATMAPKPKQPTPKNLPVDDTVAPNPKRLAPASNGSQTDPSPVPPTERRTPPPRLGNYELDRELGRGGMGSVYQARQISLDRDVALKLLADDLAGDEEFVARFTREAYAAAQLAHHNVVQVHDIGSVDAQPPWNFFSMEFVRGANLGELVKDRGRIPAAEAVGLVLQAGRGLRYAHDMGMVHRDVKPENLLLNEEGIVKVADLGLAKRVGEAEPGGSTRGRQDGLRTMIARRSKLDSATAASATMADVALGTPAYMAPEQADDAAAVDQRADIYALGCTLYHLLVGRPPFLGETAEAVIRQHQTATPTPPDTVEPTVPRSLGGIVMKMIAKQPSDRQPTMRAAVAELELWLEDMEDVRAEPDGEDAARLKIAAKKYRESPWAVTRRWLIPGFFLLCAVTALAAMVFADGPFWKIGWAGGIVGVAILAIVCHVVIAGLNGGTHLWARLRQMAIEATILEWLGGVVFVALLLAVLASMGLLVWWVGALVIAGLLAAGFHFGVDLPLQKDRAEVVAQLKTLVRRLRQTGYDENAIRHLVATKQGDHWEELFEELFGFEEKMKAREAFGRDGGKHRPRWGAWREPILRTIDRRLEAKRLQHDEKQLIAAEKRLLKSKGIGDEIADKQAKAAAVRYLGMSQGFRKEAEKLAAPTVPVREKPEQVEENPEDSPETPPANQSAEEAIRRKAVKYTDPDFERIRESWFRRRFGSPIDLLLGPPLRFSLGLLLMAIFALWLNAADITAGINPQIDTDNRAAIDENSTSVGGTRRQRSADELEATVETSFEDGAEQRLRDSELWQQTIAAVLPPSLAFKIASAATGIAGLILLSSIPFNTKAFGLLTLIAAGSVLLLRGLPLVVTDGIINWWMAATVGGVIYLFALTFYRKDEGY